MAASNGVKIGSAYIDIRPQIANGSAQNLQTQLGGSVNGTQIGQQVGGQVAAGTAAGIASNNGVVRRAMGSIGSSVAAVGTAVGGITAGLMGVALKGGISRALNIEDAQNSLTGLGHSAEEVQTIMGSALASVKGTHFGLDEAAKVAASSVAAGIKPGEDLTRILKIVADSATIAGSTMGDMGQIFNKVAASGKMQGDVIDQLSSAGVPVLQFVAKEMKTTASDVADLASKGKINFETFANAMEHGLGGSALTAGNTFRGSLDNTKAAMSRFGATVAGPFLTTIKGVFDFLIPVIDGFTARVKPVMDKLGFQFAQTVPRAVRIMTDEFNKFIAFIPAAVQHVQMLFPAFDKIKSIALPLGGMFAAMGTGLLSQLPIIGALFPAISPLVGLLTGIIIASPELRSALGNAFSALLPIVQSIVVAMGPLLVVFSQITTEVAKFAAWFINLLVPVFPVLVPVILAVVAGFKAWTIATTALTAAQVLLNAAQMANPFVFILSLITLLIVGFVYAYTQVEWFRDGVNGALVAIGGFFVTIYEWIVNVGLPGFGGFFVAIYEGAVSAAQGMDGFFKDTAKNLRDFSVDANNNTRKSFEDVGNWFNGLGNGIQGVFAGIGSWVRDSVRSAAQSINSFIRDVQNNINSLLSSINSIGFNLPGWMGGARIGTNFGPVSLPHFANGGTIAPTNGGTLGVWGEAGRYETIVDTASLNRHAALMEKIARTDNTNRTANGDVWNINGTNLSAHDIYNEQQRMKTWDKR